MYFNYKIIKVMGVKKGTNNFLSFQKEKVKLNSTVIKNSLNHFSQINAIFPNITKLAHAIACDTGLSKYTLFKNTTYKRLLLEFLEKQRGAISNVYDSSSTIDLLKMKIETYQMTIKRLESELKILHNAIKNQPKLPCTPKLQTVESISEMNTVIEAKYHASLQAIIELLIEFCDFIQLDKETLTISYTTGHKNNPTIVGHHILSLFYNDILKLSTTMIHIDH